MKRGTQVRIGAFLTGRVKGIQRRTGMVWVKMPRGICNDLGHNTALFPRELVEAA